MFYLRVLIFLFFLPLIFSCSGRITQEENIMNFTGVNGEVRIMTLDPGHFHAALVQKTMYDQVNPVVHVYAPEGPELQAYLNSIESYNTREEDPTQWQLEVYTGPDFLNKMLEQQPGNLMITAGNNQRKTEYIKSTVDAGIHVLADKPMAIDTKGFELLKEAFNSAENNEVLLYDIMTERYEISTMLQKDFSLIPDIFGDLQKGTPEDPAVTKESVHHFFKFVSGKPLIRPAWFFDVTQQGAGIVDVTTHLVDLVQWECFPEQIIDYEKDIDIINARQWPTNLTPEQFKKVTQLQEFPDYLQNNLNNNILRVNANGEINYRIKDVHARVSVIWNYEAPEGTGDTHYSIMKGSKSNLVIRQGEEQQYRPELYIEPVDGVALESFEADLIYYLQQLQSRYKGLAVKRSGNGWMVIIPESLRTGHEAHFGEVTQKFLQYLKEGRLPAWEVPNMITKYYITTKALEIANRDHL
ncbi:putative oxidoreductase C-terminal domain-containing protein [soil metagenome]